MLRRVTRLLVSLFFEPEVKPVPRPKRTVGDILRERDARQNLTSIRTKTPEHVEEDAESETGK